VTTPAPSLSPGAAAAPASSAASQSGSTSTTTTSNNGLPPVKHVFLVVLSDQGFSQAFVHTASDPYLGKTLAHKGELIYDYYGVTSGPLANEIAMVSGQGPTAQTATNCPVYESVLPGAAGPSGQVLGFGCVYPKSTETIASQLTASHRTWRAYVQVSKRSACIHPQLGAADTSQRHATWRNPFMYFRSLTAKPICSKDNVGLARLTKDLKSATTTPALSYIVPDTCHDGSDVPCVPNAPAGLAPADAFLKSVIPEIKRSPAYKDGGLIAITFDQAPQTGTSADFSSCCGNPSYPNLPPPVASTTPTTATTTTGAATGTASTPTDTTSTATTGTTGPTTTTTTTTTSSLAPGTNPGGGQVGLLLLSRYVKKGSNNVIDTFNHFSLLASIEDLFGLKRLGYAADKALPVFGTSVYTAYTP
jgi:hypothetical protein